MSKKYLSFFLIAVACLTLFSCSKTSTGDFQINERGADFNLFTLFNGYRSLEQAWNSVDGRIGNQKLADLLNADRSNSMTFLTLMGKMLESDRVFLDDVKDTLGIVIDSNNRYNSHSGIDSFYSSSPAVYQNSFYSIFEQLTSTNSGIANSTLDMTQKILSHIINTKTNPEIRDFMEDLVTSVSGVNKDDFMDLAEMASKMLIQADYPMWLDGSGNVITDYSSMNSGTNSGIGNSSKGVHALLTAFLRMKGDGGIDRNEVYELLDDLRTQLSTSENKTIIKELICNVEDYFTAGGAQYTTQGVYSTSNSSMYSDSELQNLVKDLLAGQVPMLLRDDRPGALTADASSKKYLIAELINAIDTIYIDWDKAQIKESIYDLIRYDSFGRDRQSDPNAYKASLIESFLFLGALSTNFGWEHGGGTDELNGQDPHGYDTVGNDHGHGAYTGEVSLNDSLFSIKSKLDALSGLGTYDLAFDNFDGFNRDRHIFRSRKYFTAGNRDSYRFSFDYNIGALKLTSGACVGDVGSSTGGNPGGGDGHTKNAFMPYTGNGIETKNLAAYTLSWITRACWEGEGPYYYADPDAEEVTHDGKTWKKYMRPNGKVYAYVRGSGAATEYHYPAEGSDPVDTTLEYGSEIDLTHSSIKGDYNFVGGLGLGGYCNSTTLRVWVDSSYVDVTFEPKFACWLYYAGDVASAINSALSSAGLDGSAESQNNKVFIRVNGELKLENISGDPLKKFFGFDVSSISASPKWIYNSGADVVNIKIDGVVNQNVTIPTGWLKARDIADIFRGSIGQQYLSEGAGSLLVISQAGDSSASIEISNVSGNGLETYFSSSEPINLSYQGQRENRYRETWRTDFFMITMGDGSHYTPEDVSGSASGPGCVIFNELIPETSDARACASQEEAIFRNYQWVMTEKKFAMIAPMWLRGTAVGCVNVESPVFQIIEGNGFTGLTACRKFRGNGVWAKANLKGTSTIPGDYRIRIKAKAFKVLGIPLLDQDKVYDETLGRGTATPAAIGHNIIPLARFAFPRSEKVTGADYEHYQLGSQDFSVGDSTWLKRNALTPMIIALFGMVHEKSTVDNNALLKALEGLNPLVRPLTYYNYNISGNVCTNGWITRIQGESGGNAARAHANFLLPDSDVLDPTLSDGDKRAYRRIELAAEGANDKTAWHGGWAARNYYQPADYPTLLTFLIDRDSSVDRSGSANLKGAGLLSLFTEYNVNAGAGRPPVDSTPADPPSIDFDDPAGLDYNTPDFDNATYSQWGILRRIFYSLEQLTSSMKIATKGAGTTINENNSLGGSPTKDLIPPKWLFQKRDVDLEIDEVLVKMIGPNANGTGLAHLPDDKPAPSERWDDFEDPIDDLTDLMDKYLAKTGECSITEYLLDIGDAAMAQDTFTDDQVSGLLYSLGKLLAYYDSDPDGIPFTDDGTWIYQGDDRFNSLFNIMKKALPHIHNSIKDDTGNNYAAMMQNLLVMIKDDGLARYVLDVVSISPYTCGDFFEDLHMWLDSDLVSGPNTTFWSTMASLLYDMGNVVGSAPSEKDLVFIYESYGFQRAE